MNIGIDIDDTLSNTYDISVAYGQRYNKDVLGRTCKLAPLSSKSYMYLRTILSWNEKEETEFWDRYYEELIHNVVVKNFAKDVIKRLRQEGHKIYIVTARFTVDDFDVEKASREWLDKNEIEYDEFILNATNKAEVVKEKNIEVFVDDSVKNLESMKDLNIKRLLMDSRINMSEEIDDCNKRVYSWIQVDEEIRNKN